MRVLGVGRLKNGTNALDELPIGEASDPIAEADQRGQNRHHALFRKTALMILRQVLPCLSLPQHRRHSLRSLLQTY